jgi:hypothetical protein
MHYRFWGLLDSCLAAVEAVTLRKEPVELVARIHNIPLRTAFDWLARYRQGGWHSLIEKTRQGRPTKVTGDDMKWLYYAITMGNPLNYKLPFCLSIFVPYYKKNARSFCRKAPSVDSWVTWV